MNTKQALMIAAALAVGYMLGKRKGTVVGGGGVDKIADTQADWWTYAGGWAG